MNDTEYTAGVRMDLYGNFQQQARQNEKQLSNMARTGQRQLGRLNLGVRALDNNFNRYANRTLAGTGAVALLSARRVMQFDKELVRLKTTAALTDQQMQRLKDGIFKVSARNDVRVEAEQTLAAIDAFMAKTGDFDYVEKNLLNIGYAMQGVGMDATTTGNKLAALWEKGIRDPKDVSAALNRNLFQSRVGTVSSKDQSRVAPELLSVISTKGPAAVNQMEALHQIYAKTTGSADKAKTSIQATFRVFDDPKLAKKLDAALTAKGLAPMKNAAGELRDVHTLLMDIACLGDYRAENFGFFDSEALVGFKSLFNEENRTLLNNMVNGIVDMNGLQKASAENAATAAAAMNSLANAYNRIANTTLTGPIKDLADSINQLDSEEIAKYAEYLQKAVAGWVALSIAAKGFTVARGVHGAYKWMRGLGAAGAAGASVAAGAKVLTTTGKPIANGGAGLSARMGVGAAEAIAAKKAAEAAAEAERIRKATRLSRWAGKSARFVASKAPGVSGLAMGTEASIAGFDMLYKNVLQGTSVADAIGRKITEFQAYRLGNDEALETLKTERLTALINQHIQQNPDIGAQKEMMLRIELTGPGAESARVIEQPDNSIVSGESMESY